MFEPLEFRLTGPSNKFTCSVTVKPSKPLQFRPRNWTLPAKLLPVLPFASVTSSKNTVLKPPLVPTMPEFAPTVLRNRTCPVELIVIAAPVPSPTLLTAPPNSVWPLAVPAAIVRSKPPPARVLPRVVFWPLELKLTALVSVTAPVKVIAPVPLETSPPSSLVPVTIRLLPADSEPSASTFPPTRKLSVVLTFLFASRFPVMLIKFADSAPALTVRSTMSVPIVPPTVVPPVPASVTLNAPVMLFVTPTVPAAVITEFADRATEPPIDTFPVVAVTSPLKFALLPVETPVWPTRFAPAVVVADVPTLRLPTSVLTFLLAFSWLSMSIVPATSAPAFTVRLLISPPIVPDTSLPPVAARVRLKLPSTFPVTPSVPPAVNVASLPIAMFPT